jgi:hypothetical protein
MALRGFCSAAFSGLRHWPLWQFGHVAVRWHTSRIARVTPRLVATLVGVAALLWLATGYFTPVLAEKGTSYTSTTGSFG